MSWAVPLCHRCAAARFSAARASPSALHMRLCPARQSACEQAVPQYQAALQALWRVGECGGGVGI